MRRPRHGKTLVLLVAGLCVAATAAAQRGRFGYRLPPNPSYDGGFMFCRIMFRQASNGDGGGWAVDYPRADMNLPYRLSELTLTPVSRDAKGNFNFRSILAEHYPIPHDGPVGALLAALGRHPWRPAHLHFLIEAPGYERLITHVFREGDRYLDSDAVFGVRSSLIADWVRHETVPGASNTQPYYTLNYDFVLNPTEADE